VSRYVLTDTEAEYLSGGTPFDAGLLAISGTVEHADCWTAYDWLRWSLPILLAVMVAGPVLLLAIEYIAPWDR
jgi:hypothetical protein